eukprot:gene5277-3358_t
MITNICKEHGTRKTGKGKAWNVSKVDFDPKSKWVQELADGMEVVSCTSPLPYPLPCTDKSRRCIRLQVRGPSGVRAALRAKVETVFKGSDRIRIAVNPRETLLRTMIEPTMYSTIQIVTEGTCKKIAEQRAQLLAELTPKEIPGGIFETDEFSNPWNAMVDRIAREEKKEEYLHQLEEAGTKEAVRRERDRRVREEKAAEERAGREDGAGQTEGEEVKDYKEEERIANKYELYGCPEKDPRSLRILQLNINGGLLSRRKELLYLLELVDADVALLQETKLRP